MGLHRPDDYNILVKDGMVRTSGGSFGLAKGEVGFFQLGSTSKLGLKAVSEFDTAAPTTEFIFKRGSGAKDYRSFPFTTNDVLKLHVRTPKRTESTTDKVILGWNGVDDSTAFQFRIGESRKLTLKLTGEPINALGYTGPLVIDAYIDSEPCMNTDCTECNACAYENCLQPTSDTVNFLKNYNIGGGTPLSEVLDIKLVHSCKIEDPVATTPVNIFNITIPGCTPDLGAVQAAVRHEAYEIEVVSQEGINITYQAVSTKSDLTSVEIHTFPSVAKCGVCEDGVTAIEGGIGYIVVKDDAGADESGSITPPNLVKVTKIGAETYLAVTSAPLTDAEIQASFGADTSIKYWYKSGSIATMCDDAETEKFPWEKVGECEVATAVYYLVQPLDECGKMLPAYDAVVAAYPDAINIGVVPAGDDITQPIAFTGTPPAEGDGITACQVVFQIEIATDVVCPDCDPIFKNGFTVEKPADFNGAEWTKISTAAQSEGCKCGILFEGKKIFINPDECLKDQFGFTDGSVKIEVTGGYITDNTYVNGNSDTPMAVTYLSRAKPAEGLGGTLFGLEETSQYHFTGVSRIDDRIARAIQGTESVIDPNATYVDIALTLKNPRYSQSFSRTSTEHITYHFFTKVGEEAELVSILESLAAKAGAEITLD